MKATTRCSRVLFHGFSSCSPAIEKLRMATKNNPIATLTTIENVSSNRIIGIININANPNFDKKLERVDSQTSLEVCTPYDSSEI